MDITLKLDPIALRVGPSRLRGEPTMEIDNVITFANACVRLLYPEARLMRFAEVTQWAADEWYNNAPAYRCNRCHLLADAKSSLLVGDVCGDQVGGHAHFEPVYPEGERAPVGLEEAIEYLSDLGVATFAKGDDEQGDDHD